MMASVKNVTSYSKRFFFFWKSLSQLVCMPSFKSINCSSLSRKNMMRVILLLFYVRYYEAKILLHKICENTGFQWLAFSRIVAYFMLCTSVGIGLIERDEHSDTLTLNYELLFQQCILQTILQVFLLFVFLWNEIF